MLKARIVTTRIVLLIAAIVPVVGAIAVAAPSEGCTPRREAAFARIAKDKADCAMQDLTLTPAQMLAKCGPPSDVSDVQDLVDLFLGAQAGAAKAGARVPRGDGGT